MLGILKSKKRQIRVGVDFLPTGVAAVAVHCTPKQSGALRACEFLPAVGHEAQKTALQAWVNQHGLKNAPCHTVIAKHDVQLFQIEKPRVEDNELLQAVSWKLQDLVSFDISAAVVDVFDLPSSGKSQQQQTNAVVANETVVGTYVERVRESGLALEVIDIHDLVGKHYCQAFGLSDKTYALLHLADTEGSLSIYHDGDLYFTRDLKVGALNLEAQTSDEESSLYDRLLLELQRSMDYFESHFGLGQVQELMIFPPTPGIEKMASYLQNYVAYEIDFAQVKSPDEEPVTLDRHCFAAYCAALRGMCE